MSEIPLLQLLTSHLPLLLHSHTLLFHFHTQKPLLHPSSPATPPALQLSSPARPRILHLSSSPARRRSLPFRAEMTNFTYGEHVEVTRSEGFIESYHEATVIGRGFSRGQRVVKYATLKEKGETSGLIEVVDTEHLRPAPLHIVVTDFKVGDVVDAWMHGGWWAVKIVAIVGQIFVVRSNHLPDQQLYFAKWRLRLHQEWDNDVWVYSKKL